jgi:HPt (histidine-containing phosphotransfer) domain-containing protein
VHLSHQTLGDSALEAELLSLFDRQARQFAHRLSSPMTPRESKWRADLAHTLKGSARAIGAFGVGHAAEAYERALLGGAADADEYWLGLENAIDAASAAIAHLLGRA